MQIGLSREANHCLASLRVRALINNRRPILAVRPKGGEGRLGSGFLGMGPVFVFYKKLTSYMEYSYNHDTFIRS